MKNEWVFGRQPVLELLRAGRDVDKLVVAEGAEGGGLKPILAIAREQGIPVQRVPRQKLNRLIGEGNHQGVVAQVAPFEYVEVEELFRRAEAQGEVPFFLLLDGIKDPHNLGSILRTADAAGVHGIIIPKRWAVGITPTAAKTSAGAVEYVPVARVTNLGRTVDQLKQAGVWIVGSDGEAKERFDSLDYTIPLALVIGSEGEGISRLLKQKCDFLARLPMKGHVSSLNASVAAALLMYEVLRSRQGNR